LHESRLLKINFMSWQKTLIQLAPVILAMMVPSSACADDSRQQANDDSAFSQSLRIEYDHRPRTLLLTGQAVRKILFMEIYTMAHYLEADTLEAGESVYQAMLESPGVKQVTMIFSRALRADQIQKSLLSGIKSNSSNESYQQMQPDIRAFMDAIGDDVDQGDEFGLRWYPDGTMEAFFQGDSIISIKNNELAKTMWTMWFGERAVVDRKTLVDRLVTNP